MHFTSATGFRARLGYYQNRSFSISLAHTGPVQKPGRKTATGRSPREGGTWPGSGKGLGTTTRTPDLQVATREVCYFGT